jgi:hypothetical protein
MLNAFKAMAQVLLYDKPILRISMSDTTEKEPDMWKFFFKRGDAVAMVFGVVMRDLSIALAIAMTAFGKQGLTIALLIALAYVIQIQSAAWYVRLVEKIFGKVETAITGSVASAVIRRCTRPVMVVRLPQADGLGQRVAASPPGSDGFDLPRSEAA